MTEETLFTKIRDREIPSDIVYEDEEIFAFRDINPQAPTHVLVVPKEVIPTVNDLDAEHAGLVGRMVLVAQQIAREEGIAESGYRLVMNTNDEGGQTVFHIHLHVIGGRTMEWPPG
jgi:histidine triad (HIT) family protein